MVRSNEVKLKEMQLRYAKKRKKEALSLERKLRA